MVLVKFQQSHPIVPPANAYLLQIFVMLVSFCRDINCEPCSIEEMWQRFDQCSELNARCLSSMSSEIGLTVGTRVMYVHTLIDAAWNKTAS